MGLFLVAVSLTMGTALTPYWISFATFAVLFLMIPGLAIKWWNWSEARGAVSEMWAFGELNFKQVSRLLTSRKTIQADVLDARLYIDVMHEQIGDSLAESEREVMKVIEEIGTLSGHANEQREHIGRSIESGRALTESTHARVERNKETIGALEVHLGEQMAAMRSNFARIEGLAREVHELTPLIKVITSIAQQTSLLALNAEIEAARERRNKRPSNERTRDGRFERNGSCGAGRRAAGLSGDHAPVRRLKRGPPFGAGESEPIYRGLSRDDRRHQ
jgi:hypothetical protein